MKVLKRTWADISLDNLEHNYKTLREHVGKGPRFLGVVKADQSAVVFLCKARRSKYVIIQLPFCVCHVYHKERQQKHSFISAL